MSGRKRKGGVEQKAQSRASAGERVLYNIQVVLQHLEQISPMMLERAALNILERLHCPEVPPPPCRILRTPIHLLKSEPVTKLSSLKWFFSWHLILNSVEVLRCSHLTWSSLYQITLKRKKECWNEITALRHFLNRFSLLWLVEATFVAFDTWCSTGLLSCPLLFFQCMLPLIHKISVVLMAIFFVILAFLCEIDNKK